MGVCISFTGPHLKVTQFFFYVLKHIQYLCKISFSAKVTFRTSCSGFGQEVPLTYQNGREGRYAEKAEKKVKLVVGSVQKSKQL